MRVDRVEVGQRAEVLLDLAQRRGGVAEERLLQMVDDGDARWHGSASKDAGGDAGLGGSSVGGRFSTREDRERDPAAEALQ